MAYQTFKDFETIVVDNGSTDGSVKFVQESYPEARVVSLPENKGFAGGVNEGIRRAKGEFIFLLNNDTVVDPNCLRELHTAMVKNQEAAILATKMLFYGEDKVINAAGDCFYKDGYAGNIGFKESDIGQYQQSRMVFGACAGAALYRAEMLREIGCFDADFFLFYEDVDVDFRAQLMGYKCLYVPTAIVYHIHSGTAGRWSPVTTYFTAKNDMNVLVKNMPFWLFLKNVLKIFIKQQQYAFISISLGQLMPFLRGEIRAFVELPVMLVKRYRILQKRRVSVGYIDSILCERGKI